ncbi:MAG TPA: 5-methyltetrahydropteroyltriglutamate--homocysteine S-methyltransferase [Alphaproteobacteria bacterium]
MPASKPPFKADVVGSLLRPQTIHEARARREKGEISAAELRDIEAREVEQAVAMQKAAGLKVCTDGEFHRRHWFLDFLEKIEGVEVHGGLPAKFHNEQGDIQFSPPRFEVHEKLKRNRGLSVDDFKSLKPVADKAGLVAKQPIPSPTCVHFRGGRAAIDKRVYPDIEQFFDDLVQVYREEIRALYNAGCRYLQIDDTNFPFLCDPKLRENARKIGEDPNQLPRLYVKLLNDTLLAKPADMTVCVHMCRGNHESSWVAEGGYDPIAELVFGELKVDGFFLEYDSPRAGTFAPLRYLARGKTAVLGLVTTKKPDLETKDLLKRRIEEAAKVVPLDKLALSPQCGFASTIGGNRLSIDDEKRKLELVVTTAQEVWGTA